jgi:hypothetical protein
MHTLNVLLLHAYCLYVFSSLWKDKGKESNPNLDIEQ